MSDLKVKTISINPELFKVSKNTQKQKPTKMLRPAINKTTHNRHNRNILRAIRDEQEKIYKDSTTLPKRTTNSESAETLFRTEFQESLDHLSKLTVASAPSHNKTLKQHPLIHVQQPQQQPQLQPLPIKQSYIHPPPPTYGCLKTGGRLPTYKTWKNQTQRNNQPQLLQQPQPQLLQQPHPQQPQQQQPQLLKTQELITSEKHIQHNQRQLDKKRKTPIQKQKKTIRRKFQVGKSKTSPKISVLVSNKTIRNNTMDKKHATTQVSIQDIRSYLIKHGMIKVGSTAPNDVLRKMYESMTLMCGEVQNHNPETLLYNYMNTNT